MLFLAAVAVVLLLVGYKWYRIFQAARGGPLPDPSVMVWPRTLVLGLIGLILIGALAEILVFHVR
jgi:hypothetical protein